jgi:hypothetical protein
MKVSAQELDNLDERSVGNTLNQYQKTL